MMIRVSKLADYSVVVLSVMMAHSDTLMSAAQVSSICKLPEPTVSKVLKLLGKANIIESKRGINGGYIFKKMPEELTVKEIIKAIDGPISVTSCTDGAVPDCTLSECCSLRGRWDGVNAALRDALETVTLADMVSINQHNIRNEGYGRN